MNELFSRLAAKLKRNPKGLYVLFYTEMWELFGRFGIGILLSLYMTKVFKASDEAAFAIYSGFLAMIYITPIFGGYIADRVLGNRRAIIFGGTVMCLSNLLMVIPQKTYFLLGLAGVAVGSGFFLPSIAPLVSAIYEGKDSEREAGFTWFYMAKNLGALTGPIFCGIVAQHYGFNYAFLLSALGMGTGVLVFILNQKHLGNHGIEPNLDRAGHFFKKSPIQLVYLAALLMIPCIQLILERHIDGYLLMVSSVVTLSILIIYAMRLERVARDRVFAILFIMLATFVFMAFLNQGGTTLNLFIDRIVDRHVFGVEIPTTAFYALDPAFMLIIGPFLAVYWTMLARRSNEHMLAQKLSLSLLFLAVGFFVFSFAAYVAMSKGEVSSLYVVAGYFIFPIAELCIMPVGLSMVTQLAPKGLESFMVGVWMLSNSLAAYFTGYISSRAQIQFAFDSMAGRQEAAAVYQKAFQNGGIVLIVAAVFLLCCAPLLRRLMHMSGHE